MRKKREKVIKINKANTDLDSLRLWLFQSRGATTVMALDREWYRSSVQIFCNLFLFLSQKLSDILCFSAQNVIHIWKEKPPQKQHHVGLNALILLLLTAHKTQLSTGYTCTIHWQSIGDHLYPKHWIEFALFRTSAKNGWYSSSWH